MNCKLIRWLFFQFLLTGFGFTICNAQQTLQVQNNTWLVSGAGNYVVLNDVHLVNNGTINIALNSATFKFSGSLATNISGTTSPLFNAIDLAKTGSAQLILQRDIGTWGNLHFTSGILNLNNHVIDLAKFGYLTNENESSHIIGPTGGYIQWSDVINAPSSLNPGNLGAILTSTQNLGTTTIRRGHVSQTNGVGAGSSVLRYYDIVPTNNSSVSATLRFNYLDAELNGLTESSLTMWKSSNLTSWTNLGFDSRNTSSNYVDKNGLDDFSRWTLSTPGNALPVHFSVFNTRCNGNSVTVKWVTESERNTKSFDVQKSIDGKNWITAASLPAAGNSPNSLQYSFTDNSSLQNFYRIAEVDINGRINYSTINRISCGHDAEFKLWPNPATSQVWLSVGVLADERADVRIIDQQGKMVYFKRVSVFAGNNMVNIDAHLLPSGGYVVELIMNQKIQSIKLIKL